MKKNNLSDYLSSNLDPEEIFQILEKLGEGTFGAVYKILHKETGNLFAAKILPVESSSESFKKEIQILKQCKNQYIVNYYGSYNKDNQLWIILEFCNAGSILDLIKITKRNLNEKEIASIVQMILKGLIFLHDNNIIHRDVKASNILLNLDGYAKLSDFGVSALLNNSSTKKNSRMGSPYWMSPEVISQNEYSYNTDIWSLGITCIELAEGEPPFHEIKPNKAMMRIVNNPPTGLSLPNNFSFYFNDFVQNCLIFNPNIRPSAKVLINHEFIINNDLGHKLIAEVVAQSIEQINNFRNLPKEEKEEEEGNETNNKNSVDILMDLNLNTVIEKKEEKSSKENTFIESDEEYESISKHNIDKRPLFLELIEKTGLTFSDNKDPDYVQLNSEEKDKTLKINHIHNTLIDPYKLIYGEDESFLLSNCSEINILLKDDLICSANLQELEHNIKEIIKEKNEEVTKINKRIDFKLMKTTQAMNILAKYPFLRNLNEYIPYLKFKEKMESIYKDNNSNLSTD